jgi:heptosyltransferase-1
MRVVLVRLSALGDIVHTWPLADALKAAVPDLHLTWVVERGFRPLVEHHPAVDEVLTVNTKMWRRRPLSAHTRAEVGELRQRFRASDPDVCIDPQGVFKSAVMTLWTGAPRRIGLSRPWRRELLAGLAYTETLAGSRSHHHVVATNLEMVRAVNGTPPSEPPRPDGRWVLERCPTEDSATDGREPLCVLLPGAGRPTKVLAVETLAVVARGAAAMGLDVVVAWGPSERDRAAAVVAAAGDKARLAPSTDLLQLASLLAGASLAIGGDTGPVHLAASLGTPTVAVFVTTSERRNRPLGTEVAVVSAVDEAGRRPSGSAQARAVRVVGADEILAAARALRGEARDPTGSG